MAYEDQHYQQGRFIESTTDPPICHEQCFTNLKYKILDTLSYKCLLLQLIEINRNKQLQCLPR